MFFNPYYRSFNPYYTPYGGYGYGGGYGGYNNYGINAIGSQIGYQSLVNTGTFTGNQTYSPTNIW
jgi:hypothetical protein